LGRMNFSLALMSGRIKGVQVDADRLVNSAPTPANATATLSLDPARALAVLEASLLLGDVSKQTHDAITKELENQAPAQAAVKPSAARKNDKPAATSSVGTIAALILGSPEFQKR
jgi:hypothetical protein